MDFCFGFLALFGFLKKLSLLDIGILRYQAETAFYHMQCDYKLTSISEITGK